MLVSFSLENYRSYASKGVLEMMPGRSRNKNDHIREDCLPIAAIYGNNASGKSNLVHGLKTMKGLVTDRFYSGNESLNHWKENDKRTRFCIEFTVGYLLYRYELEVESKMEVCKGSLNNLYLYPVTYECLSYVDLHYESDKNGNIIMIPILERTVKDYSNNYWYENHVKNLYRRKVLISKLERCNKTKRTQEIELIKEGSLPSSDSDELIEKLLKKRDKDNHQRQDYRDELNQNKAIVSVFSMNRQDVPSTLIRELHPDDYSMLSEDASMHLDNVRNWFNSSLIILGTSDIYIPNTNDSLNALSTKIKKMDLGIDYLKWRKLGPKDVKRVTDTMSINDQIKMDEKMDNNKMPNDNSSFICKTDEGIFRLSFNSGKMSMESLTPVHLNGRQGDLYSESDGTVRMIELASMLTYTEDDVTFVVDEMDRRLHPLLTHNIVDSFLGDKSPLKQLIFTTHETEILTTELFRKDEIWFVEKSHGYSTMKSLDVITGLNHNKRLNKLYLEGDILPKEPNLKQSHP